MKFITWIRDWCAGHKKLTVTIVGSLVALIPDSTLDQDKKKWIVELVIGYVVGQGVADHGKEAAKLEIAARGGPGPIPTAPLNVQSQR